MSEQRSTTGKLPRLSPSSLLFESTEKKTAGESGASPSPNYIVTPSTTSSASPIRDGGLEDEPGDVCSAAMDFVTFIDTDTLRALEERMSGKCFSRSETVQLIIDCISSCRLASNPLFASQGDDGRPLRKSDADFRTALRNATTFSMAQIEALVDSVDKHGSNRIRYSDIMSFLVAAGRKAGSNEQPSSGDVPASVTSSLNYSAKELLTSSNYISIVSVPERNCFLAATLRWIDILDETLSPMPASKQVAPPHGDPTATISCVAYVAELDEIIVGFNNRRLMTFNFVDGRRQRDIAVTGTPMCMTATPREKGKEADSLQSEEDGLTVFVGTDVGTLVEVTLIGKSIIRVGQNHKIAATRISQLLPFFDMNIVVAVSGKCFLLCDSRSGVLLRAPYIARGVITAAMGHSSTASLVFATTQSSNSLFFFPRRVLKSHILENPGEVSRKHEPLSLVGDTINILVQDAYSPDNVISVTTAGVISLWNVQKKVPVSAVPEGGEEVQLRLPPTARHLIFGASLASRPGILIGGKTFVCQVTRKSETIISQPSDSTVDADSKKVLQQFDTAVVTLPLLPRHSAFPHSKQCVLSVFPGGVQVHDMLHLKRIAEVPFPPTITSASSSPQIKHGSQVRIRCACFGPGMTLLLGSEDGDVFVFSLESSSLGEFLLLHSKVYKCEISSIFFHAALSVVGFAGYDGCLSTAVVSPDCDRLSSFITATAVHRCDALHYCDDINILSIVDLEEQLLRICTVVDVGTRLQHVARVSVFSTPCSSVGSSLLSNSGTAQKINSFYSGVASQVKSVKVFTVSNNAGLKKQLFQDESEVATIFVSTSVFGAVESSGYVIYSLTVDDDEAAHRESTFLTRLHQKHVNKTRLELKSSGTVEQKAVTCLGQGTEGSILVALTDGLVWSVDGESKLLVNTFKLQQPKSSLLPPEPVTAICFLPFLNNVAICRGSEKPSLFFRKRRDPQHQQQEQEASPVKTPDSNRKVRSAKPERPKVLLSSVRSGSAGTTPSKASQNSILEAISRSSTRHHTPGKGFHLPPLSKKR